MADHHALHWHTNLKAQQFNQHYLGSQMQLAGAEELLLLLVSCLKRPAKQRQLLDADVGLLHMMCEMKRKRKKKQKQKHARRAVVTPRHSQALLLLPPCPVVAMKKQQGFGWQLHAWPFVVRCRRSQAGLVQ